MLQWGVGRLLERLNTLHHLSNRVSRSAAVRGWYSGRVVRRVAYGSAKSSSSSSYPEHVTLTMPALSPTMKRGTIAKWLKPAGSFVADGDIVANIETDEATQLDFVSVKEGYVAKVLVEDGDANVSVGQPVALLVEEQSDIAAFEDFAPELLIESTQSSDSAKNGKESLEVQIISIQHKIEHVEKSIVDTEAKIRETEAAIQDAAEKMFKDDWPGRDYWLKKEADLTNDKAALRKKEEDLRKKEEDLRKEKEDLRKEKALLMATERESWHWREGGGEREWGINARVMRPLSAFSQGEDGDMRWMRYVRLEPDTSKLFEEFVELLLRAELCVKNTKLELNGSLNPPLPLQEKASSLIEIFHIDLKEYREHLAEKDDLHVGAFDSMHIVRLPVGIPEQFELGSNTLWVTGDDLAVLKVIRSLPRTILLGNPGIGKSWLQWQYLLYSLRPDVYTTLCDDHKFPTNSNKDPGAPPSVIIRYEASAKEATVFFLSESKICVHSIRSMAYPHTLCKLLDAPDTSFLFEPGEDTASPVPYLGLVKLSIIATVSPDQRRYKEFQKHGGIRVYLPCPSKAEILVFAACVRPLVSEGEKKCFEAKKIIYRIDKFGPFPRYVLAYSDSARRGFDENRNFAVDDLRNNNAALQRLAALDTIEIQSNDISAPVSHWFLCYHADRKHQYPYSDASKYLVVSSQSTLNLVREMRDHVELQTKIRALKALHNRGRFGDFALEREWLEDVFACHAASKTGLKWHGLVVSRQGPNVPKKTEIQIKFQQIEKKTLVKVNEMEDETLYYRINSRFPFFDGVWKSGGRLFAFQATTSKTHPKPVETFEKALEKIGIDELQMDITIYYVVMPRCFEYWHDKNIPPSFYWKKVNETRETIDSYSKHIKFALLCPPDHFGASI
jgi:hypothetical protein